MEIDYIKNQLLENEQYIVELLEVYGFHNIRLSNSEIRCSHDTESNATSVRVRLVEGLPSTDFAKNITGDIFTVIMNLKKCSLFELIQKAKHLLGLGDDIQIKQKPKLFGGVYDSISRRAKNQSQEVKTYEISLLDDYDNGYSKKFMEDGINLFCQKYFRVGYDVNTDRITVPWYSFSGELVGVMGRYNGKLSETHAKWFPVIPFSKSCTLFGFYQNYEQLVINDYIFIGESEKFVMQLFTMGYRNSVALGGNHISDMQIKQLLTTQPKYIIFALDEGLDINMMIAQCLKVKNICEKFNVKVGYVYDKRYEYLTQHGKQSPSDLGKSVFDNLIQNCIVYV